jgi:hypothetical protein
MAGRSQDSKKNTEKERFSFKFEPAIGEILRLLSRYNGCNKTEMVASLLAKEWLNTAEKIRQSMSEQYKEIDEFLHNRSHELTRVAEKVKCNGTEESPEQDNEASGEDNPKKKD